MRLSMIAMIMQLQTEVLIIIAIMRKPNAIIVLLFMSSAMTKLIKVLISVLGDVTSACIKLLSVGMTSILHI